MPEIRHDPIVDRWVILAPDRESRPRDFAASPFHEQQGTCPFCPGNEAETPPEVYAERKAGKPNGPGWNVRVVPNKFPALDSNFAEGGTHEVLIEGTEHSGGLADRSEDVFLSWAKTIQQRISALLQDERCRYVQVFKNDGPAAGATLTHGHTQLIAMPLIPPHLREKIEGFARHRKRTGDCVLCDLVAKELAASSRIIFETESFVALSPYAARVAYESWLIPKQHVSRFDLSSDAVVEGFALAARELLARTAKWLGNPAYNLVFHAAASERPGQEDEELFHWHVELLPRQSTLAGFEWGSGVHINSVPPELAAEELSRVRL